VFSAQTVYPGPKVIIQNMSPNH